MSQNIVRKIFFKIGWILDDALWIIAKPIVRTFLEKKPDLHITIGVTTFMDRYDNCLKPLIKKLSALFPGYQIIVVANGHVKQKKQAQYLHWIREFCKRFPSVEVIPFMDPRGLSHLWNVIMTSAISPKVFLLNDDVQIKMSFSHFIRHSGILDQEIATLNSSWSHFMVSKDLFRQVGPFDEGLKELGGEDDDYAARLAIEGIKIGNYYSKSIAGKLRRKRRFLKCNSYGKDMSKEPFGYSRFNSKYLFEKWETSMEYFDGSVLVPGRSIRYWKLREKRSQV